MAGLVGKWAARIVNGLVYELLDYMSWRVFINGLVGGSVGSMGCWVR